MRCMLFPLLLLSACSYLNQQLGLEDDNVIEQSVEGLIKAETGLEIDLTPGD